MNKEYINELFKRKKEKFKDSETEIISSKDLENYILDTITSNFLYDFNIDIDLNKLFEKNIDIEVNNNRIMRITPVSYTHLDVYKRQGQSLIK